MGNSDRSRTKSDDRSERKECFKKRYEDLEISGNYIQVVIFEGSYIRAKSLPRVPLVALFHCNGLFKATPDPHTAGIVCLFVCADVNLLLTTVGAVVKTP